MNTQEADVEEEPLLLPHNWSTRLSSSTGAGENALDTSKNTGSEPVIIDLIRCVVVVGASATYRATTENEEAPASVPAVPPTNERRNGMSRFRPLYWYRPSSTTKSYRRASTTISTSRSYTGGDGEGNVFDADEVDVDVGIDVDVEVAAS